MRRTTVRAVFVGLGVLGVLVLAAVGYRFIRPMFLPIYQEGPQTLSKSADFMVSTLFLGDQVYESDLSEFSLESTKQTFRIQIGRTSNGLDVVAIPGQDSRDYLVLTGFMFPDVIYRRVDIPAPSPDTLGVDKIKILVNQGSGPVTIDTGEPAVIAEVVDALTSGTSTVPANPAGYHRYKLMLFSPELKGLDYFADVLSAGTGPVFLATRLAPEVFISTGDMLAGWLHENNL